MKHGRLVLIGSSTGGPKHILKIVSSLPKRIKACIVIAHHMEDSYLHNFTKSLSGVTSLGVHLAYENTKIEKSNIYVTTKKSVIKLSSNDLEIVVNEPEPNSYNPDINTLFTSVSELPYKLKVLAIILTGIGEDGANGLKKLSQKGSRVIAESQESAVVYGMPKKAAQTIENIEVLSLDEIIKEIVDFSKY